MKQIGVVNSKLMTINEINQFIFLIPFTLVLILLRTPIDPSGLYNQSVFLFLKKAYEFPGFIKFKI
jgi:hypothetical protein